MHILILTPYQHQGSIFAQSLKRHNVYSTIYHPNALTRDSDTRTDAVFIPHALSTQNWSNMQHFINTMSKDTPVLILNPNSFPWEHPAIQKIKSQIISWSQFLSLDEIPLLIKNLIKTRNSMKQDDTCLIKIGDIHLDREKRCIRFASGSTQLTRKEFFLLELLIENIGQIITRERIVDHVWDRREFVAQNTIDVYMSRLRKKLKHNSKACIETIPCLGYQFKIE